MNEINSIDKLTLILNEFYHQSTSNFRKKEIERELVNFQSLKNSWEIINNLVNNSYNNQYLWFFSVSTVEICITKKWNQLLQEHQKQIREILWYIYSSFPMNVGAMQRDKIAQLIALVGKRQFPDEHPDYVNDIISLVKTKFILGITLLKATFTEIVSTKADITYQKKRNFVQCMTVCLSDILPILNKFLVLCVCRILNHELVIGADVGFDLNVSLPNDDRFSTCCCELLNCIQNIFSWSPNSDTFMNAEFFNNIFELCLANDKFQSVNISALMTISELFYLQKPLPQPMIQANGITELIQQKNLNQSNEEYQDKFTELLKLFTTQQWSRFVGDNSFPAKEFLLHLFNFTFSGAIGSLTFTERLTIWTPIIKSFNEKIAGRYTETIVQLITNIFKKMQFQYDQELDLLDTEDLDENMETELQHFLNQCIDVISVAAEVEPNKIYDLINHEFNREDGRFKIYVTLLNSLPDFTKESGKNPVMLDDYLAVFTHEPAKQLFFHCMLRDLSTILQVVTRLCSVVLSTDDSRSHSVSIVIRSCLFALKLANTKKLHLYKFGNYQITTDLVELHAQMLTSVRSLVLLKNDIYENYDEIYSLIDSVTQLLLPSRCDCEEPAVVVNSAAQLLLTISSSIRPNYILKNPFMLELMQSDLTHQHDHNVKLLIKRIIFNCLLLPYSRIAINNAEDQNYEKRGTILQQYVSFVSHKFLNLDGAFDVVTIREITKTELKTYEELVMYFEDTNTITKQMLLASIKTIIDRSIELFQKYGKDQIMYECIVNFYLSVIRVLQIQLGSQFVIQVIKMFLDTATASGGHLTPQNMNVPAVDKLLQLLLFIVQQSGSGSTANILMNDILKITLDDMLPCERTQSVDISVSLYSLFDAMLQNHWNYFQRAQNPSPATPPRNHQEDLMRIFTAYGQFLVNGANNSDPNVIRIILRSLEKLNEIWKLYDKIFFKTYLLKSFLSTLIRLAISPEGGLFYDQCLSILFTMSEKNKPVLHDSFISIGYPPDVKIIQQICETTDQPSFLQTMDILIIDTRFNQFLQ